MLTHTRAFPPDGSEFGNMNGFFVTEAPAGVLTCTLWNADASDTTVRTVEIQPGLVPSSGFIPIAVKKIVSTDTNDYADIIVIGV